MQYDVFISHSSRDKDEVARPLAQALEDRGLQVWLDEEQLQIGDSIRRGIDAALRESRFGLVVLSPAYLNSEWGQKELDAFFAKEKYNTKSILPIYHGISIEDVEQHWPMLADKISLSTTESIEQLADKIQQSIQNRPSKPARLVALKNKPWWPSNNWQWLIGIILALAAIVIPIWHSTPSPSNSGAVNITGNMSGGTAIGTQINHPKIDLEAAQLIAKSLLQSHKQTSGESLQEKEAEIKELTETIARLQQQPSDELKQRALKKLEADKPEEAALLLKQSLVKRGKALQVQSKQMSEDWMDVGNIAHLKNTEGAFEAYSKAIELDPANSAAWNKLGHINRRLGNLGKAIKAYETVLKLAGDDQSLQSVAYGNLGLVYRTQGNLGKAEVFHLKSLKINESLGHKEGMATQYGNLGLIYLTWGKLGKAQEFLLKALKINKALNLQVGMASQYGNLGAIYRIRGELDKAEEFFFKALKIIEPLSLQERMAIQYGNLGLIYSTWGELDKAEKFLFKALKIDEDLGRKEGMATQYGNISLIYQTRGELDKAEEFLIKALKINEALGRPEGMAYQYSNLGAIYKIRGELEKAEGFLLKALKINEALDIQKGMATQYGNLGLIYSTRGELDKAEEFQLKALKINEALGHLEGIAHQNGNLGLIYRTRGELDKAEEFLLKSLIINEALNRQEGIAADYSNLVLIYATQGELDKAEEFLLKALKINEALGRKKGIAIQYSNLGVIYSVRGDLKTACKHWLTSLGSFNNVVSATTKKTQRWIDKDCQSNNEN